MPGKYAAFPMASRGKGDGAASGGVPDAEEEGFDAAVGRHQWSGIVLRHAPCLPTALQGTRGSSIKRK